ncbi:MAG TPA: zeta toxin family protein [Chlamydiales bacterium]|nr:zeta toxin family protein [Chlamydiales bacterium]
MTKLMMIAGPNGAGKTTTTEAIFYKQDDIYDEFINADHIARGLSPLHPESVNVQAGRLMIQRFHECLSGNKSFVFETTASGLSYVTHLKKAKTMGYTINLIYLWLSSPELAVKRVARRVQQGGHNIPEADIRRRYFRGLKNLINLYLPIADTALILDNSAEREVVARKELSSQLEIENIEMWEKLQEIVYGYVH